MFTRYHEVGVTKIRPHQIAEPRLCKRILGYDANALYLSTVLREVPCGKGKVVHYTDRDVEASGRLVHRLKNWTWFVFPEVDIEIPERLWPKFEEMYPFFYNKQLPVNVVPQHTLDYLKSTRRKYGGGKNLVRALSAE